MGKESGKIAKRYARALFESCSGSDLDAMLCSLSVFEEIWRETPSLKEILENPAVVLTKRLEIVSQAAGMISPDDQVFANFLCTLMSNGRLECVSAVKEAFLRLIDEYKKILSLEITSAFPLSEDEKTATQAEIQSRIPSQLASLMSVSWKIDRSILGGMIIKAGDRVLDGSVKGALQKIEKELRA